MNVGKIIKVRRKFLGLRQNELSLLSGVSASHLCLIENNLRDPSVSAMRSIAKALKMPLCVLIYQAEQLEYEEQKNER